MRMVLHLLNLFLTGDSTMNCTPRRPLKTYIPHAASLLIHFILKILTCIYLVFPRLGRIFTAHHAENDLKTQCKPPPIAISSSQEEQIAQDIEVDPLWQRLKQLEGLVTELTNKPTKIPQEKEDMLCESLSRIKSIEYDLQKTKKVRQPSFCMF